jgi:hypothetical protein
MKPIVSKVLWSGFIAALLLVISIFVPTTVTVPENPTDPRAIYVIDHGTHTSLVIQTSDNKMLRYSYGDFRYYALRDTSLASGAAALFWPTPATLGRGQLEGPVSEKSLRDQLVVVVEQIYELEVAAEKADRLILDLDAIFFTGKDQLVKVPEYGLIFAPHPIDYFWNSNSSTMIGVWLKKLGADVFGWALISSWNVGSAAE